jgi:hypothetical protein
MLAQEPWKNTFQFGVVLNSGARQRFATGEISHRPQALGQDIKRNEAPEIQTGSHKGAETIQRDFGRPFTKRSSEANMRNSLGHRPKRQDIEHVGVSYAVITRNAHGASRRRRLFDRSNKYVAFAVIRERSGTAGLQGHPFNVHEPRFLRAPSPEDRRTRRRANDSGGSWHWVPDEIVRQNRRTHERLLHLADLPDSWT